AGCDQHPGAIRCRSLRDRQADTRCSSKNDDPLVLQRHGSLLLREAHFPLCPPLIQTHPSPYKDDSESLSMFDARLLSGISVMIAVVEAGSFVRAADALGLTPSGVSRAIARLEARISIRL